MVVEAKEIGSLFNRRYWGVLKQALGREREARAASFFPLLSRVSRFALAPTRCAEAKVEHWRMNVSSGFSNTEKGVAKKKAQPSFFKTTCLDWQYQMKLSFECLILLLKLKSCSQNLWFFV